MTGTRDLETGIPSALGAGEACLVVHPRLKAAPRERVEALLAEAVGLAEAIRLDVTHTEIVAVTKPRPSTLLGSGAVERLAQVVAAGNGNGTAVTVAVIDAALSPVQQRNLERAWRCKVIDRTGLILEIFGARAQTREGRLQVDLAALTYQRSRLVRSWTHLERQRGGAGFMGGPGETQIETDRRLIDQRITRLKRELDDVRRTRKLHRDARRRVPYPVVALVGYTNAGKSTLFNRLTRARVKAKDQLFATLDPTMRALAMPSGRKAILSDTVGFISQLPHELVNAFHATLEEVIEADILVHVRDTAHPDTETQKADVLGVLHDLGLGEAVETSIIEVLNKSDLLDDDYRRTLANQAARQNFPVILVSASTGDGCELLVSAIDERLAAGFLEIDISLAHGDGAALAWLYDHGEVIQRDDTDQGVRLRVRLDPANAERFHQQRMH